ncbi:MAG: HD domain-containing protein [Alphaproteobacteria bacterium]|nr:HD domain-containing protein [Alphaproteobacteria bacterium]
MEKAKSVVEFYLLCTKLKDVVRTGWKQWNVRRERVESIAEHIFGVQTLAIAMWSQYGYDIDIRKVIMMIAVHEMEELVIGDLTRWDITPEEKLKRGHEAVKTVLKDLVKKEEIEQLIFEYDAKETLEAKFAYRCDKMEACIQAKRYDAEGCVDLKGLDDHPAVRDEYVQELLRLKKSWSSAWIEFNRNKIDFDKNFSEVLDYIDKAEKKEIS